MGAIMNALIRGRAVLNSIIASETWTGTTGAAWPSQWSQAWGGGTPTIQSGAGAYPSTSTAYSGGHINLSGMSAIDNTDLTCTVVMGAAGVEQYAIFSIDGSGTDSSGAYYPNQCYALQLNYKATNTASTLTLHQSTNGTATQLATFTKTLTGTTVYNVRVQRLGTTLRGRVWTGTEPSTWDITYTLSTAYTGKVALGVSAGSVAAVRTATFDNLTVTNTPS
jgi:hypothetical protein